ncbi:hypothetical protein EE612_058600, partial [Oryza sativa]
MPAQIICLLALTDGLVSEHPLQRDDERHGHLERHIPSLEILPRGDVVQRQVLALPEAGDGSVEDGHLPRRQPVLPQPVGEPVGGGGGGARGGGGGGGRGGEEGVGVAGDEAGAGGAEEARARAGRGGEAARGAGEEEAVVGGG